MGPQRFVTLTPYKLVLAIEIFLLTYFLAPITQQSDECLEVTCIA